MTPPAPERPAGAASALRPVSAPLPDAERSAAVFSGELLVFPACTPLRALCARVDGHIRRALGDDPQRAHLRLPRDVLSERTAALSRDVRRDAGVTDAFAGVLGSLGVDVGRTCWDWFHLRVQPPADPDPSRTLGHHRDTWSSNVYAQTNWWFPVHPITAERTVAFHPHYWLRPLPNSSAAWDLDRLAEMPLVPAPTAPVDVSSEIRVVIDPGDVLCFSGAHVHASVPNTSDLVRFSVEVRTVGLDDVDAGRQAPNVDGAAPRVAWRWFRSLVDRTPLPDLRADLPAAPPPPVTPGGTA